MWAKHWVCSIEIGVYTGDYNVLLQNLIKFSLMYADVVVILSTYKTGLEEKLDKSVNFVQTGAFV